MAHTHFAEIDKNNKVIRVVVACEIDVANNGGDQSVQAATHFATVCPLSSEGVAWVQTSKDGSFRKKFAGIGDTFSEEGNVFYTAESFPSWTMDSNYDWNPPVARPTTDENPINSQPVIYDWDEANQKWSGFSYDNDSYQANFDWNPDTSAWEQV